MNTGFVGLGNLGKAIAARLIAEGVPLRVWNRTKEKAFGLKAESAGTPASLAQSCDVIFLNLFDSAAVEAVLAGPGGILSVDCTGKIIVDTTTNHPEKVKAFHGMVSSRGGAYLEAPVLGSVIPASQGALTMVVSGAEENYRTVEPLLRKFCKTIHFLGAPGLATRMKLINNLVLGTYMAVLAEAVALGEKVGIEKGKVIEILGTGAGNSGVLLAKKEKLLKEDFSPHFTSAALFKDLTYLRELAESVRAPLFLVEAVANAFSKTFEEKKENLDFSAVYAVMKESGPFNRNRS